MKCPGCQSENRDDAKFCNECGHEFQIACPRCAAANRPGSKFCDECGHNLNLPAEPIPKDLSFDEKIAKIQRYLPEGLTAKVLSQRHRIEGERKQVTVVFCDMEGFTQLTEGLGPEEAYSIMDQVYEILIHKVHDYEGTVNEMTGDGIVALFGAPIALEDAPQRAIRSAIAIHREMTRLSDTIRKEKAGIPPLKMRVGIHTGPVVVGTLGNDLRGEFKAVGDTVNLASRVEDLAAPGTTYVTEATFKLTEGLFRFEAWGEKEIKGREDPVNVYQVIAPSTRRTRFDVSAERGLTPFVGRERELELLLDGFERAKAGQGQAFSIVSEAGVGKSRLLYELRKLLVNEDVTFLEGRCLSYSRGIAYHPHIDILKASFDILEGDNDPEIRGKVQRGLKTLGTEEATTLPYLLELLSVKDSGIDKIPMSPETRKERIIEAIKRIALKGTEIRPWIMAIEDLHWVDKSSEEVLKRLLESIPGARVLLIFTYRPEFVHTWGGKSFHSQVNLNRLSNRESLSMVTHLLGTQDLDRGLEELILGKTEGVPFFIEEFVKSLKDLKLIETRDKKVLLAKDIEEMSLPATIQDVITARIDSLPQGAKEVLQTGSVIDREFSYVLIKRVTELPEQELLACLSGLKDAELLYERGIYPQTSYIFKHALTQEVAYNSLLLKKRNEIHEKVGRTTEEIYSDRPEENYELLAHHYVHSTNIAKAVEYLDLANQKAARGNAMEAAKGYFDQAMELLDRLPDSKENQGQRVSLLVNQLMVFNLLLKTPEYYDLLTRYEPFLAESGSPGLQGAFYARLGGCEFSFGFLDQAVRTLTEAAELCEADGNAEDAALAYGYLQYSCLFTGDFERALDLKEAILRKMDERFDLRWYVGALGGATIANSVLGRWDEAMEEGQKALAVAQEFADNGVISLAAAYISGLYTERGDMNSAIEYAELAVAKAPTPLDKAWSQTYLAAAWCRSGEPRRGIDVLAALVQNLKTARMVPWELNCLGFLCGGYLLAEEYDRARQTAEGLLQLAERCGSGVYVGLAHGVLGEVALQFKLTEAGAHFEKSIALAQRAKARGTLAIRYSGMGRFHKQQGNAEQARDYLMKALELFEGLGTLIQSDMVRNELAELPEEP